MRNSLEADFKNIGIIGVGLIGGSIGLAVKAINNDTNILGFGRNPEKLHKAIDDILLLGL